VQLAFARGSEPVAPGEHGYPIAVVDETPRVAAARDFLDELLHGEGPRAFAARGLATP
jgi:hypothetical protein